MAVRIIKQGVLTVKSLLTQKEVFRSEGSVQTLSRKYKEFLKSQQLLGTLIAGSVQHTLHKMATFTYKPISQPKNEKYECTLSQLDESAQPCNTLKQAGIPLKDSFVLTTECLGVTRDRIWGSRKECNEAYEALKAFHDGIDRLDKPTHREFSVLDEEGDIITVSMKHYTLDNY